ncbi:MAG TPA: hypothetical protein VK519_04885 [Pinirhizobacter sp.]|uniref:hypothetical protein n=1 Tax=Pinirhizobacter sp. TaxID=2950432 RepID=UPI002CCA67AC|nr:hypothetical protein [Pinirhizobacter sp.]HMH67237.1 hypothetical protein [Pinirhizobacter sp.]
MSDLNYRPYQRPPMTRGLDPQRVNWLWRLVCEVAGLDANDVVAALHAMQVPVDHQRVASWLASDRDDNYFPLTVAEMERNLRSVLALRKVLAEASAEALGSEEGDATSHYAPDLAPSAVESAATA